MNDCLTIKPHTIKLISRYLNIMTDEGIVSVPEAKEIISQLRNICEKGELRPVVVPKLINQKEAAEMLGLGLSNFKKLEKEGALPFKRRMVGSSVRYRNTDVVDYIMSK
ncbi:MAG: hypothetical protein K9M56_05155 [Victivallales bacterium]|nr:hypothetical protein [Victivallales bacterium]